MPFKNQISAIILLQLCAIQRELKQGDWMPNAPEDGFQGNLNPNRELILKTLKVRND